MRGKVAGTVVARYKDGVVCALAVSCALLHWSRSCFLLQCVSLRGVLFFFFFLSFEAL